MSKRYQRFAWHQDAIARLGKVTDSDLAAELGISPDKVTRKRVSLQVAKLSMPHHRKLTQAQVDDIYKRFDAGETVEGLAARFGVFKSTIQHWLNTRKDISYVVWTQAMVSLLGRTTDAELAELFKVPVNSVRGARERHGILSAARTIHKWSPDDLLLLGTAPDEVVGRKIGVSTTSVKWMRRVRGVPRFKSARSLATLTSFQRSVCDKILTITPAWYKPVSGDHQRTLTWLARSNILERRRSEQGIYEYRVSPAVLACLLPSVSPTP